MHSDQLPRIPPQELKPAEVDAFLDYLFSAVARRPAPLSLREGAAVARYLTALAWETEPGYTRQLLERLGHLVWGMILQYAPFTLSRKQDVVTFLEKHAATYLTGFDIGPALAQVRQAEPPTRWPSAAPTPRLMSRHISVHGSGNPQLADDLSERIYASYHALRRARVHGARGKIAKVLNRLELKVRVRTDRTNQWDAGEVYERVKQHEARLRQRLGCDEEAAIKQLRDAVVDRWLYFFHSKFC
jgi:hypothetical protein